MPDVPIALRLSGHLLIGIVRIYSWKVNHLYSDCNKLVTDIRKAFASVPVDLSIEADHAPFESVTLPETFDLNALELDESYYRTALVCSVLFNLQYYCNVNAIKLPNLSIK